MDAVIRKWGNSPAVRLNSSAMKVAAFDIEQRVTIKASKGRIVIEPIRHKQYKLDELLSGITSKNRHEPIDTGVPVGKEIW